jgi:hypothetical protein
MVTMVLEGRCLELAIMLADQQAWDILDSQTEIVFIYFAGNPRPPVEFYVDPATALESDAKQVAEAVEYLTLRGLVHPHPSRPTLFERYPQPHTQ